MTIDWWTLGLQAINVLILVWLLGRFFWRPVASMIEERRAAAQRILTDAEAKRGQATAALVEIDRVRDGFAQERETILAAAREVAGQARTEILENAAKDAASLEAAAKAAIENERQAAEKAWAERASRLAIDIAGRLVARLDGPAVRAAFLDGLLENIRSLPDSARRAVAADSVALEAIGATPIEPAEQERCRILISEAFDAQPRIAFTVDSALIAGLELRGPQLVVRKSRRADLAQILTDLTHDHEH